MGIIESNIYSDYNTWRDLMHGLRNSIAHYGALAIWRGDEYMLNILFAAQLQLWQRNNARQQKRE
jgi:hypothetical protein